MLSETILLRRFGRQLRMFRKQKMLSREELASESRLSIEEIEELEGGFADPSLKTICRIAAALHVPPEELLIPSGGRSNQYYAWRCHLLKLIGSLSKKDIKKVIDVLHKSGLSLK